MPFKPFFLLLLTSCLLNAFPSFNKTVFKTMDLCELLKCSLLVRRYVNLKLKASLPQGEKYWV